MARVRSTTSADSDRSLGMWILLVDVFTAGPLGPNPRLFAVGVAVFLAGWGLTRAVRRRRIAA